MLSTFIIAIREGLEASLIVGILVAYLVKSDRKELLKPLWLGVAAAIVTSLGLGAFLSFTSAELSDRGEQLFAGLTSIGGGCPSNLDGVLDEANRSRFAQ